MTPQKQIERLKKLLEKIYLVNHLLLQLHNIPILARVNAEIKKEIRIELPGKTTD